MAQSLEVNIKTTSDVPQAVSRANDAITSLEKRASNVKVGVAGAEMDKTTKKSTSMFDEQFSKIGKSFGNTISSVFLSFAGPMALLSGVMSFIGNKIEESKRLAEEGLNKIAEGETTMATDDEKKMANFFKMKEAREKEEQMVAKGREAMTEKFLRETEEGKKVAEEAAKSGRFGIGAGSGDLAKSGEVQKLALEAFLNSEEGKKYAPIFKGEAGQTQAGFKAPEGFGNVVGVGANPVLQAMTLQLEETRKQTQLLEQISQGKTFDDGVPVDFTKEPKNQQVKNYSF